MAPEVVPSVEIYQLLTASLIPLWLLVFLVFGLYDSHKVGGVPETAQTFHASTTATMLVILGTFLVPQFLISRMWLVTVWLLSTAFVIANRGAARRITYALRRRGCLVAPALIVGTNREAASLGDFLKDWQASGLHLLGFVSTKTPEVSGGTHLPVLGSTSEMDDIIRRHGIEELIVAVTAIGQDELVRLYQKLEGLPVHFRISSGLYELLTTRVGLETLGTVPLLSLHRNRLDREQRLIKAVLDVSLATTALLLLLPFLLLLALVVRLDSPGPILHRRRVLGTRGRQFDAFKLRTMYVDGDDLLRRERRQVVSELETNHKLKGDPRVTRVGRWLRRYSLDEWPQLLNVLRGEMSLVGPRMISPAEGEKYGSHRSNLLTVKPGITGLWQVSGRSDLSYEERVRLDMYYIRNYSVWLDLQILFIETLPAVLKARGAY